MMWRVNCFLVSTRTESKLDYHYVGGGSKTNGIKEMWGTAQRGMGSMDYRYGVPGQAVLPFAR